MDTTVGPLFASVKEERPDYEDETTFWNGDAETITVKVEPTETDFDNPDENRSPKKIKLENGYVVSYPSHLLDNNSVAHFYIAKLSQKLNLKLNNVPSPLTDVSSREIVRNCTVESQSEKSFGGERLNSRCCQEPKLSVEDLEKHKLVCLKMPSAGQSSIDFDTIEKPNVCDVCGKGFLRIWNLKKHYLTHTDPEPFICVVCTASFETVDCLKIHQAHHLKDTPYVCPKCNRGFPNRESLREHARIHVKDMPFSCRFCGKRFMQAKNLGFHTKVHSGFTIYPCDECEKAFDTEEERIAHKTKHNLIMPFKCKSCKQSFPTRRQLQIHSATHEQNHLHKCQHCHKTFDTDSTYRAHIREEHSRTMECPDCVALASAVTFDGKDEFMCEDCDLPFLHENCLSYHKLAHLKGETIRCGKCDLEIPHIGAYHRHMLNHAKERRYYCTICLQCFFTRTKLKEHMIKHWKSELVRNVCGKLLPYDTQTLIVSD